jgi:hypothetical protein
MNSYLFSCRMELVCVILSFNKLHNVFLIKYNLKKLCLDRSHKLCFNCQLHPKVEIVSTERMHFVKMTTPINMNIWNP